MCAMIIGGRLPLTLIGVCIAHGFWSIISFYSFDFRVGWDLQRWIEKWATKNMLAGVPRVGAEEGWYLTHIIFETLRLQGNNNIDLQY